MTHAEMLFILNDSIRKVKLTMLDDIWELREIMPLLERDLGQGHNPQVAQKCFCPRAQGILATPLGGI